MKPDELNLLHGHLNGTLTDADFGKLQALLRASAEARRFLRTLATVDAKLQALGSLTTGTSHELVMPPPPPAPSVGRSPFKLPVWSYLAAAACLALAWTLTFFIQVKPTPSRPDVAAAISSTRQAIARLSLAPPPSFPAWASPTAPLLEQPLMPQ